MPMDDSWLLDDTGPCDIELCGISQLLGQTQHNTSDNHLVKIPVSNSTNTLANLEQPSEEQETTELESERIKLESDLLISRLALAHHKNENKLFKEENVAQRAVIDLYEGELKEYEKLIKRQKEEIKILTNSSDNLRREYSRVAGMRRFTETDTESQVNSLNQALDLEKARSASVLLSVKEQAESLLNLIEDYGEDWQTVGKKSGQRTNMTNKAQHNASCNTSATENKTQYNLRSYASVASSTTQHDKRNPTRATNNAPGQVLSSRPSNASFTSKIAPVAHSPQQMAKTMSKSRAIQHG